MFAKMTQMTLNGGSTILKLVWIYQRYSSFPCGSLFLNYLVQILPAHNKKCGYMVKVQEITKTETLCIFIYKLMESWKDQLISDTETSIKVIKHFSEKKITMYVIKKGFILGSWNLHPIPPPPLCDVFFSLHLN